MNWTVLDCPVCGCLHPIVFDERAGIDGDNVVNCPIAGRLELSSDIDHPRLREVVSIEACEP